jgi:lipopolysaccharide/colanic/teichoic acid biosynthesis glycosyltransferase
MQRLFDIFFSGFALLILTPLFIPIAIALKFSGEGEIFYAQQRVGRDGKKFSLLKFATMLKDSPNLGTGTITIKNDPRILPFGSFLRKTKINELPQLVNVFWGDMSIVGPRPQTLRCFEAFTPFVQNEIIKVRPGLSGIGSIIFRDEESLLHSANNPVNYYNTVITPYKGEVEKWYIHNQSLHNYFLIILVTVWIVLFSRSRIVWRVFPDLPKPPKELTEI